LALILVLSSAVGPRYWLSCVEYVDTQYVDTQYVDTQYVDTQYVDTQYVDTQYVDTQAQQREVLLLGSLSI